MHSFSSLAERLEHLVSRQTLSTWVQDGVLQPAKITRQNKNTHLLFPAGKLNQLHRLLQQSQILHAETIPLGKNHKLADRIATGKNNARAAAQLNERRRQMGRPEVPEPNPATNADDAIGRVRLTFDPSKNKNHVRIFGGFGKWKTQPERKKGK